MKKIYYKVFIRFYKWINEEKEYDDSSKYLCNEGYAIIQNDCFIGFLGLDFLQGQYEKDTLLIQIRDFNNFGNWYEFSNNFEDFYLPNSFLLESDEYKEHIICEFLFEEMIKDKNKKSEIDKDYADVCELHNIKIE